MLGTSFIETVNWIFDGTFIHEKDIKKNLFCKCYHLTHAIPKLCTNGINNDEGNYLKTIYINQHLIKSNQIHSIEKPNAKELYSLSISLRNIVSTLQKYFKKCFPDLIFEWKDIYTLSHVVTVNSQLRVNYKILNNAWFLNKHLFIFKKCDTKLCPFCNMEDEAVIHLFSNCFKSKTLWNSLK